MLPPMRNTCPKPSTNGMIRPQDEKQESGDTVGIGGDDGKGRQIGSNRGQSVSTGTTRSGFA